MIAIFIIARLAGTKTLGRSRQLGAWCEGIARFFSRRSAIASLSQLDDRALRDIGVERSQIEAAVHGLVILRNRGTT
jgi:uncharacterized protein YjiS (DUF1127 family)